MESNDASPIDAGVLVKYATYDPDPIYPEAAKRLRKAGFVKVFVTINEIGEVAAVEKTSGTPIFREAARRAIKNWKFKPFIRDGQPVKATGVVGFRFVL